MAELPPPPPNARELTRIRLDRGLTQAQLAERAGAKQPEIQRLESGERRINARWAKRLGTILECHWLDIVDQQWFDENQALTRDETALVELYRELAEDDRRTVYRIADAIKAKR